MQEFIKTLSEKELCFNCPGRNCPICQKKHHTSICDKNSQMMLTKSLVIHPVFVVFSQTFDELPKLSLLNVVLIQLAPFLGACGSSESQYLSNQNNLLICFFPLYLYHFTSQFNVSIQRFFSFKMLLFNLKCLKTSFQNNSKNGQKICTVILREEVYVKKKKLINKINMTS